MKTRDIVRLTALGGLGLVLAACGGGGNSAPSTAVVTPSSAVGLTATFGTGFATDFAASPNSTPAVPKQGDIIPLTLTQAPTPLHQ